MNIYDLVEDVLCNDELFKKILAQTSQTVQKINGGGGVGCSPLLFNLFNLNAFRKNLNFCKSRKITPISHTLTPAPTISAPIITPHPITELLNLNINTVGCVNNQLSFSDRLALAATCKHMKDMLSQIPPTKEQINSGELLSAMNDLISVINEAISKPQKIAHFIIGTFLKKQNNQVMSFEIHIKENQTNFMFRVGNNDVEKALFTTMMNTHNKNSENQIEELQSNLENNLTIVYKIKHNNNINNNIVLEVLEKFEIDEFFETYCIGLSSKITTQTINKFNDFIFQIKPKQSTQPTQPTQPTQSTQSTAQTPQTRQAQQTQPVQQYEVILQEIQQKAIAETAPLTDEQLEKQIQKYPVLEEYYMQTKRNGGATSKRIPYEKRTVTELRNLCKQKKVKYTGLKKAELIAALRTRRLKA